MLLMTVRKLSSPPTDRIAISEYRDNAPFVAAIAGSRLIFAISSDLELYASWNAQSGLKELCAVGGLEKSRFSENFFLETRWLD